MTLQPVVTLKDEAGLPAQPMLCLDALPLPCFDAWPAAVLQLCPQLTLAALSIHKLAAAGADSLAERRLTATEQAEYHSLGFARRRLEWLGGRLAAKAVVAAFGAADAEAAPASPIEVSNIGTGPTRGRPVVNRPVWISVSHSAGVAVAAAASFPVGVDVERDRPLAPVLVGLLRADPVDSSVPAMPVPLRWACKEAVLKCLGVGLRIDSRQVILTRWAPSGWFEWRPGPTIRADLPPGSPDPAGIVGWAGQQNGYSFAVARLLAGAAPPA